MISDLEALKAKPAMTPDKARKALLAMGYNTSHLAKACGVTRSRISSLFQGGLSAKWQDRIEDALEELAEQRHDAARKYMPKDKTEAEAV